MIFQGCCFKNAGVAGYVEAFGIVQLENQASYIGYLFRNRCTSYVTKFRFNEWGDVPRKSATMLLISGRLFGIS